mgnify:FL=1
MGRGLMDGLAKGFGDIADLFSGCLVSALAALLAAVALIGLL